MGRHADAVNGAGDQDLLRQLFVHGAGHCIFTPAEQIAAFQSLVERIDTGSWGDLSNRAMDQRAAALGARYNGGSLPGAAPIAVPAAFAEFTPPAFPREFDSRSPKP